MSINLITQYGNQNKPASAGSLSVQNGTQTANNKTILQNKVYMKPQKGKGKLLKGNVFDVPKTMVKDIAYDIKSVKNGLSGHSNDHQLGTINDLGMKLGGLGIASYLFTQKVTPKTKGMEFIGFISFFASMAIWPKIALQWPARIIHGFDVQQKYQDSQGRKKRVFTDPQYIPWDLYSDKQINKIGDRLKVSKDIPNRRGYIQEKMKKIAVQNNTMWMLTAGFATPIMSALICNQAEKTLSAYQNKKLIGETSNLINNFKASAENLAKEYKFDKHKEEFNKTLESLKGQDIDLKSIEKLVEPMAPHIDTTTKNKLSVDLLNMFKNDNIVLNEKIIEEVMAEIPDNAVNFKKRKAILQKIMPSTEEAVKFLKANNMLNVEIPKNQIGSVTADLINFIMDNDKNLELFEEEDYRALFTDNVFDSTVEKFSKNKIAKFTPEVIEKLTKIHPTIEKLAKHTLVLDEYGYKKFANAPETVLANEWNKVVEDIPEIFNFSKIEMEKARIDRTLVQELLREKIEQITTDDKKYSEVIDSIADKITKLSSKIPQSEIDHYKQKVDEVYNEAAKELDGLGLKQTAKNLVQKDLGGNGSISRIQKVFIEDRMSSVNNTFYRLIDTLDVYRRISKGEFGQHLPDTMKIEVREEAFEAIKQIMLHGHSSDHSVKFYTSRNVTPNETTGPLNVKNGKIINEFHKPGQGVDVPSDSTFYKNIMNFMYNEGMNETTRSRLEAKGLLNKITNYNREFFDKIGGEEYFTKLMHKVSGNKHATAEEKFLLVGLAPDELMTNLINKKFNTAKWLKTFTRFGLGLVTVTLLSQFTFGKMPPIQKEVK